MAKTAKLNQKKVQLEIPVKQEKQKKASNIGPVATGMQKFMKLGGQPSENVLKASNKSSSVPMIFKQRKAPVK